MLNTPGAAPCGSPIGLCHRVAGHIMLNTPGTAPHESRRFPRAAAHSNAKRTRESPVCEHGCMWVFSGQTDQLFSVTHAADAVRHCLLPWAVDGLSWLRHRHLPFVSAAFRGYGTASCRVYSLHFVATTPALPFVSAAFRS